MFFLSKPKIKAKLTSGVLNSLPKDGVMADGPIAYFLAYQTDKRVVIIPHHETIDDIYQMWLSIREFKINYLVISDNHKLWYKSGTYPALDFIKDFFDLKDTILEDDDVYRVYEVPEDVKVIQAQAENKSTLHRARKARYNQPLSFLELCWN